MKGNLNYQLQRKQSKYDLDKIEYHFIYISSVHNQNNVSLLKHTINYIITNISNNISIAIKIVCLRMICVYCFQHISQ